MSTRPHGRQGSVDLLIAVLLAALLTFVTGTIGFSEVDGARGDVADYAYRSLQLFSAGSGDVPGPTPVLLDVARFLAPAAALALAGFAVKAAIDLLRGNPVLAAQRPHVIVCGLGELGGEFVRQADLQGRHTVAVTLDARRDGVATASNARRSKVVFGDARDVSTLRRAGLHRATSLVALCSSDSVNAEVVQVARQHNPHLKLVVGVRDRRLASQLELAPSHDPLLRTTNVPRLAASQMVDSAPATEAGYLIVGFGTLGQAVAVHLATHGPAVPITAVDRDADRKVTALKAEQPRVVGLLGERLQGVGLEFVDGRFEDLGFLEHEVDTIFICVNDDVLALSLALQLGEERPDASIEASVRRDDGLVGLLKPEDRRRWISRSKAMEVLVEQVIAFERGA